MEHQAAAKATEAGTVLSVEGLKTNFYTSSGIVEAVRDVSLDVRRGETLAIVGESGSGKSITAMSILKLIPSPPGRIVAGRVLLGKKDLLTSSEEEMRDVRGNDISVIFQEPMTSLNPVMMIGAQIGEALILHQGLNKQQATNRAIEMLRMVRIPEPERRVNEYPHQLSGGMRQRVMIAMALACDPKILIADEPTTALDVTIQAEILSLVNQLKEETGTSVIFITHDMAVVAQMADRVVVMYHGEKVEEATVEEIFENPKHPYTKALLAAVPKLGEMRGRLAPEPMKLLGSDEQDTAPIPGTNEPLLEVRNLTTRFAVRSGLLQKVVANVHAVEDVSFTINKGQTLSLVGESGCGKSTAGRSILRLVEPDTGSIHLSGQSITALDKRGLRQARSEMQMVFQDPYASLNPKKRLLEQVAEPLRNFSQGDSAAIEDMVAVLFDRVHLPRSFLNRYPHELSGGQRQRVAIARALSVQPSLIVADEAVSALDVSVQAQVVNLMMELQADLGLSYLFISHDMAVVERVSHYVGVMYLGRIVEIGKREDVFRNPQHAYTKALLSAVPVANPGARKEHLGTGFKQIPSPIHPIGYLPAETEFVEIEPEHLLLVSDSGY